MGMVVLGLSRPASLQPHQSNWGSRLGKLLSAVLLPVSASFSTASLVPQRAAGQDWALCVTFLGAVTKISSVIDFDTSVSLDW